ncbi:966_t:CDS:2 [Gigaspora rosea]|nr:966_t:CDS:2 [Gigaspora rosea]
MDYDVNDSNSWNNNFTWNISNDNSIYTWPDNCKTTESSSWNTPDDNTVVASPYNWSNNDFDDFFENSLERFKNDLFRVFTDFYYEWRGLSSEKTSALWNEQKQIVNVDMCRDDTRGGDVLIIRDKDWDTQPLYGRFLGTIVFPYKIDTEKSQLFLEQGILDIKVVRVESVLKSLDMID